MWARKLFWWETERGGTHKFLVMYFLLIICYFLLCPAFKVNKSFKSSSLMVRHGTSVMVIPTSPASFLPNISTEVLYPGKQWMWKSFSASVDVALKLLEGMNPSPLHEKEHVESRFYKRRWKDPEEAGSLLRKVWCFVRKWRSKKKKKRDPKTSSHSFCSLGPTWEVHSGGTKPTIGLRRGTGTF